MSENQYSEHIPKMISFGVYIKYNILCLLMEIKCQLATHVPTKLTKRNI